MTRLASAACGEYLPGKIGEVFPGLAEAELGAGARSTDEIGVQLLVN